MSKYKLRETGVVSAFLLLLTLVISASSDTGPKLYYFPQVAVGGDSGGYHYRSTLFLVNTSSAAVSGTGELYKDDGSAMAVVVNGGEPISVFQWSVQPGETIAILFTSGNENVEAGWLKVSHEDGAELGAGLVFQLYDGSQLVSQAAVLPSPEQLASTIFAVTLGGSTDTGIAFGTAQDNEVTVVLYGDKGQKLGEKQVMLPANGHLAKFVSELFSDVPGVTDMIGSAAMTGVLPFSAVTLRLDGMELTTLPVIPGAFSGDSTQQISYQEDVDGLFTQYACKVCHSPAMATNNFDLSTYAALMSGDSDHGPVVTPEDGAGSVLVKVLQGPYNSVRRMPPSGPYMTDTEIKIVKDWIDQGAQDN